MRIVYGSRGSLAIDLHNLFSGSNFADINRDYDISFADSNGILNIVITECDTKILVPFSKQLMKKADNITNELLNNCKFYLSESKGEPYLVFGLPYTHYCI